MTDEQAERLIRVLETIAAKLAPAYSWPWPVPVPNPDLVFPQATCAAATADAGRVFIGGMNVAS